MARFLFLVDSHYIQREIYNRAVLDDGVWCSRQCRCTPMYAVVLCPNELLILTRLQHQLYVIPVRCTYIYIYTRESQRTTPKGKVQLCFRGELCSICTSFTSYWVAQLASYALCFYFMLIFFIFTSFIFSSFHSHLFIFLFKFLLFTPSTWNISMDDISGCSRKKNRRPFTLSIRINRTIINDKLRICPSCSR